MSATRDPRVAAEEYIQEKHILPLFESLTSSLLFNKPNDIRNFLISELQKIKAKQVPSLFTENDLRSMFKMFDITERHYITQDQFYEAMKNLGVKEPFPNPRLEKIDEDNFVRLGWSALAKIMD
mmetsp:Transcript_15182/g.38352  ORF Transcript_15182/g.38352 Transcript_15182/m.38352 type:complete len:124 (-) Transcript_15182:240-611(-)